MFCPIWRRRRATCRARVQDKGLEIADVYFQASGPGLPALAINHPDAEERQQARDLFARVVEFTLRCNATHITLEPGLPWDGEPYETSLQRACEELAWRVEAGAGRGLCVRGRAKLGVFDPHAAADASHAGDDARSDPDP